VHPRAVDIAMKHNIPLLIKNTMSDCKGTLININGDINHPKIITGITYLNDRIQVKISASSNVNNPKYKDILGLLATNKISLDLINIFPDQQVFTIGADKKEDLRNILDAIQIKYTLKEECSQIAVVGTRMTGIPGVIANIIQALNDNNIEVLQTADSNMTIWCLVNTKDVHEALNALHKVFELA
ncbi:ACT domain-containing protein, partial [Clostridium chrysemydis]